MGKSVGVSRWSGVVLLSILGCAAGESPGASDRVAAGEMVSLSSARTDARVAARAKLSASGRFLRPMAPQVARPADSSWAEALDIADLVESTTLDGDETASQIRSDLGI